MRITKFLMASALTVLLAACGGGSDSNTTPANSRGNIIGSPTTTAAITAAQIDAATGAIGLQQLSGPAQCGVTLSSIEYNTVGGKGEATNALTAVMVPTGSAAACTGARPVLLYAHGTDVNKAKNMADPSDGESSLVLAMFAAQGYIVVAPNYAGYGSSKLTYHPYLNAEQQANDMIDALRVAKKSLPALNTSASSKLFISGYSQGGYVAMATHRAIQQTYASEFTVTASAPMSGPYALDTFTSVVFSGQVNGGAVIFTPLLVDSYQNSYGNIYTTPGNVYQAPYDTTAAGLFPGDYDTDAKFDQVFFSNKLPPNLFDLSDGAPFLINTAYRNDVNNNANNGFRQAVLKNDLLTWTPTTPVAMCGGASDPVVFFLNTNKANTYFQSKSPTVPILAYDLESRATLPVGVAGDLIFGGFTQTKASYGADLLANYHGAVVPPFCSALARGFFQAF